MSYLNGPFRPRWFKPVTVLWFFFGMPAGIITIGLWAFGLSASDYTEPPPPPLTDPAWRIAEVVIPVAAGAWVFGTPLLLAVTELKFRSRRLKSSKEAATHNA